LSRTLPLVVASVSVAGLGLAAVYPITISRLSQEFGRAAARVGSLMFTMANFGGASLPWLVGYSSHRFHDLRVGLVVPLVATILMYALYRKNPISVALGRDPA
jgi:fucose permease